jgi:hypothetical protein
MSLWLGLWLGCPRQAPAPEPARRPDNVEPSAQREPIEGPHYWTEPSGLCLEIPDGWAGTVGPPPLVLELAQRDTGFGLMIRTWPAHEPMPDREGFWLSFEDDGQYRTVPLLAPHAATKTWQSEDPLGPTVQAWYGSIDHLAIEIAVSYPMGRATEGRSVVDPLLQAICWVGAR